MSQTTLTVTPQEAQEMLGAIDKRTITTSVAIADMSKENIDLYGRNVTKRAKKQLIGDEYIHNLTVIYLSLRKDGRFFIIDGNHRREIAQEKGYTHMDAKVFVDLTPEEEAKYYILLNKYKSQTPLDLFRARLSAGNTEAQAIQAILNRHGLRVPTHNDKGVGSVPAVGSLEKIVREYGLETLVPVVDVLYATWGTTRRAWTHQMLLGMAQFWIRYGDKVDRDHLVDRLKVITPESLLAQALATSTASLSAHMSSRVGIAIYEYYNKYRRSRKLPEWKNSTGNNQHTRPVPESPPPSKTPSEQMPMFPELPPINNV